MPRKRECLTCEFWVRRFESDSSGDCHRYPPSPDTDYFPVTLQDEWCGEHQERPDAP